MFSKNSSWDRMNQTKDKIIFTHNPSETDQNQLLLVRFPNLGSVDVIAPGTANLSFNIELSLKANLNRALVSNIGRVIVGRLTCLYAT